MPIQDFTVNKAAWKALPDDVKAIVEQTWKEFSAYQVKNIAENDLVVDEEVKKKGVELIAWSDADSLRGRELANEVWAEWEKKRHLATQAVESKQAKLR